jgi:hypothetical protein
MSNLSPLVELYILVTIPIMIIGNFIGAFLSPLAQWCSVKVWTKFFGYLDARKGAIKVAQTFEVKE